MQRHVDPATCCGMNHLYGNYSSPPSAGQVAKLDQIIESMKHRLTPGTVVGPTNRGYGPATNVTSAFEYHDSILLTTTITSAQIGLVGACNDEYKGKRWVDILTDRGFVLVARSKNYLRTIYLFVRPGGNECEAFPHEIVANTKRFEFPEPPAPKENK